MLGSDYQVWQSEDNCRFVKYTLRCLFERRENIQDADIIHWNNGLWDTSTGLFDDGGKPQWLFNASGKGSNPYSFDGETFIMDQKMIQI